MATVEALIDQLSCPAEPITNLASTPGVLEAIEQTALRGGHDPNHDLRRDLWDWAPTGVSFATISDATPSLVSELEVGARRCGTTTLTAIDAVYQLELRYGLEDVEPIAVTTSLGILVKHDDGEFSSACVLARSGIRPTE